MADEEAHVNWAVKGVEDEVEIGVDGEFASVDASLQGFVSILSARPQEPIAKGLHQFRIGLSAGEQGGDDLTARGAKDANQAAHLKADIAVEGAGVGELEFLIGAGGEGVDDEGGLGGPPAVDGGFADVGVGGHGLDAEGGESAFLLQAFHGAAQDGLARLLAAGAAGRSFAIVTGRGVTVVRGSP